MTTAPKREWFRFTFSLRTLFVVLTITSGAAGWIAYQLNWIRCRHAILSQENASVSYFNGAEDPFSDGPEVPVDAPWSLRILGERGVAQIGLTFAASSTRRLTESEESQRDRMSRLFPVASVSAHASNIELIDRRKIAD